MLQQKDLAVADYLVKNHFGEYHQRDLLLHHPRVVALVIERDLADVVVSAYHHYQLYEQYEGSFEHFYWGKGRDVAQRVWAYYQCWRVDTTTVYRTSFEQLKVDFETECERLGDFLKIELTANRIAEIKEATSFKKMKDTMRARKGEARFYRKGEVGDGERYLSPRMQQDLEDIQWGRVKASGLLVRVKARWFKQLDSWGL